MVSLTINIDAVDRTSTVNLTSLVINDVINQRVNAASFKVTSVTGGFAPATGQDIEILNGSDKIFAGSIVSVQQTYVGPDLFTYSVSCTDHTHTLDRKLVTERYENVTVKDVLDDIIATYAPEFTTDNVEAGVLVESVTFNRIPISEAIQKLSDMSSYSWYVDYDKDIHFFAKDSNPAPFDITDTSSNYLQTSLILTDDVSQLRNRVFIRGGEAPGLPRTETFNGDGSKLFFKLANKYQNMPTVTVGGVGVDVGIDYLDQEADHAAFWSYGEKYVRFKVAPTSGTDNVSVSGIPLFPIVAQVEDSDSIAAYGEYEFAKTDTTIRSRREARDYAAAQLLAYANGVVEGSFSTYTDGLRSGQILSITARGRNEDFLIQSVRFSMRTIQDGLWTVELATLRTVGIIDVLIGLLRQGDKTLTDQDSEVLEKAVFEVEQIVIGEASLASKVHNPQAETITVGESSTVQALNYGVQFVAGPQTPSGTLRQFILSGSRLG